MDAEPPVDHDALKHAGSLVVEAHKFFRPRSRPGSAPSTTRTTSRKRPHSPRS
jgi:hypothetical protein